jgi:hypothetical protein
MLGCVRNREAGPLSENLNGAFALRKLLQQFEPMTVAQRFRNGGELGE